MRTQGRLFYLRSSSQRMSVGRNGADIGFGQARTPGRHDAETRVRDGFDQALAMASVQQGRISNVRRSLFNVAQTGVTVTRAAIVREDVSAAPRDGIADQIRLFVQFAHVCFNQIGGQLRIFGYVDDLIRPDVANTCGYAISASLLNSSGWPSKLGTVAPGYRSSISS